MTDTQVTYATAAFCTIVVTYAIGMAAPVLLPIIIASIVEFIKTI